MAESELDQDGQTAQSIPEPQTVTSTGPTLRTPRWLFAWLIPAIFIVVLIMARRVLGPFVIAGVIAYIFSMVVDNLQERLRWPRGLIVSLLYLLVLGTLGIGLYFGAEGLYQQTHDLLRGSPNILEQGLGQVLGNKEYSFGGTTLNAHTLAQRVNDGITSYFGNGDAVGLAREIVGRLLDTFLVIVVSFYLLLGGKQAGSYLLKFVPEGSRARTGYVAGRIHTVLGAYLRGQLLLILIMSAAAFVVLQFVFGVRYALPLAILTGFLEILPLLGPAIATALAAGVAFSTKGAAVALGVVVAFLILRELEDQLVMPAVVGRAVELHPVVTIFAVLAGGAMFGTLGMLLGVPVAAALKVILDFVYPTDPDKALQQARPGLKRAVREAEERKEEPAPVLPSEAKP